MNVKEKWFELLSVPIAEVDPDGTKYDLPYSVEAWYRLFKDLYRRVQTTVSYLPEDYIYNLPITEADLTYRAWQFGTFYLIVKHHTGVFKLYELYTPNPRLSIREMSEICYMVLGTSPVEVQVFAHKVQRPFEYIDYYDLYESNPRPRHRVRKFNGIWKPIY